MIVMTVKHLRRRRSAVLTGLLCVLTLGLAPSLAGAQTGSATTILGQVTDENGGALPGVTVTLKSPALQVPEMTTVTDVRGEYRIAPLPIGTYSLQFELSGFQSLRLEGIKLASGFVAKLDQVMKIGAMSETITVSGQSPLVDVTQASTATSLQGDALALIPSGTNGIVGFLAQVPGARTNLDVGGSTVTDTNIFTANGQVGDARRRVFRHGHQQRQRHALRLQCHRRGTVSDEREQRGNAAARHGGEPGHEIGRQRVPRHGRIQRHEL
jgi:hypothetical protein